jgi:uncharacterized protein (UPF0333 family)
MKKKGQVSIEYLIVMGFVTFILIGVLSLAFFYSNNIKDRIKINEITNYANKIISTSESIFYAGYPSKTTITCHLPENVNSIEINSAEDSIIISIQTSSGISKTSFSSNVPISGSLKANAGLNKIQIEAGATEIIIAQP